MQFYGLPLEIRGSSFYFAWKDGNQSGQQLWNTRSASAVSVRLYKNQRCSVGDEREQAQAAG